MTGFLANYPLSDSAPQEYLCHDRALDRAAGLVADLIRRDLSKEYTSRSKQPYERIFTLDHYQAASEALTEAFDELEKTRGSAQGLATIANNSGTLQDWRVENVCMPVIDGFDNSSLLTLPVFRKLAPRLENLEGVKVSIGVFHGDGGKVTKIKVEMPQPLANRIINDKGMAPPAR